ncbi:hypothetical protein [Kurthia huakuii]|uniref:hypothetical protein n=1 Tax=Kurthia huakuii TaxID=1421019 RepID=UPI000494EE43|nr:hypothetical protein [Kurthia huakuii]MBM7701166.1 hypothetical protein [Kurthia huakuii]
MPISFFENISTYSIQILSWTSPIVAALLALITIIFSQYNERILYQSKLKDREISKILKHTNYNFEEIIDNINDVLFLINGQLIYKVTLIFFIFMSIFSSIAWSIAGVGYFLKRDTAENDASHFADEIIIIIAGSVVSLTFLIIPIIIWFFNKKPLLKMNKFNNITYDNLEKYLRGLSKNNVIDIPLSLIEPVLSVDLDFKKRIKFSLNKSIPVVNLVLVYELICSDDKKIFLKFNLKKNLEEMNFHIKGKKDVGFEGTLLDIKNSEKCNLYVMSEKNKYCYILNNQSS